MEQTAGVRGAICIASMFGENVSGANRFLAGGSTF
jgi:hypothetical protein